MLGKEIILDKIIFLRNKEDIVILYISLKLDMTGLNLRMLLCIWFITGVELGCPLLS